MEGKGTCTGGGPLQNLARWRWVWCTDTFSLQTLMNKIKNCACLRQKDIGASIQKWRKQINIFGRKQF